MLAKEELLLIIYFIAASLLLFAFVVVFFVAFQKRKNKLLVDKMRAEKHYLEELTQSQLEIQEQTLKDVGRELHDNIGQLLSVASMQLNIMEENLPEAEKQHLGNIREVVRNSIQEVRGLSKSLNSEVLDYLGLEKSVENELARLGRMSYINFHFEKTGASTMLDTRDSVIIFRILQEFISNAIKHSEAKNLWVRFEYTPKMLIIEVQDDGVGFKTDEAAKGSGMINMSSRANLLNAPMEIKSDVGNGTYLNLQYPFKTKL